MAELANAQDFRKTAIQSTARLYECYRHRCTRRAGARLHEAAASTPRSGGRLVARGRPRDPWTSSANAVRPSTNSMTRSSRNEGRPSSARTAATSSRSTALRPDPSHSHGRCAGAMGPPFPSIASRCSKSGSSRVASRATISFRATASTSRPLGRLPNSTASLRVRRCVQRRDRRPGRWVRALRRLLPSSASRGPRRALRLRHRHRLLLPLRVEPCAQRQFRRPRARRNRVRESSAP